MSIAHFQDSGRHDFCALEDELEAYIPYGKYYLLTSQSWPHSRVCLVIVVEKPMVLVITSCLIPSSIKPMFLDHDFSMRQRVRMENSP